jgi:hypothetical protein
LGALPKRSILSAWFARLPEEKASVFDACAAELQSGFNVLSIALDMALRMQEQGRLRAAREGLALCGELAERHARLLDNVLQVLEQESRHLAVLPEALEIEAEWFRTAGARSACFWAGLLRRVLFSARTRWLHMLSSLREIAGDISEAFLSSAEEVCGGSSLGPAEEWRKLEELHDDWNTCLQETVISFKCLLDTASAGELEGLRRELEAARKIAQQQDSKQPAAEETESESSRAPERPCI